MKIFSGLFEHKNSAGKVVLIVQCRLSSTRLPGKALLDLGGKTVLEWTLRAMKKVSADEYYLATDDASFSELSPVANICGFKAFAGPLDDVLERFCLVIEKSRADTVIRATADNPFLFYEAAQGLLDAYKERISEEPCDYMTWTGLPHGSGVEIFNAHSLLKAHDSDFLTPYDHEHVGPALYKHPDKFVSVMTSAPEQWNHPELRTTIDTKADYRRALALVRAVSDGKALEEPYTTEQILEGIKTPAVSTPILFVPSTKSGHGTGHFRRCVDFALKIGADVYIPEDSDLNGIDDIISEAKSLGFKAWQIKRELPSEGEYALIVLDMFETDEETANKLRLLSPLAAIDDGANESVSQYFDYLLDIIPSPQVTRRANKVEPHFVPLPTNRKAQKPSEIKSVLVAIGGEDPAGFTTAVANAFASSGVDVTAILPKEKLSEAKAETENVHFVPPVLNLKEKLADYDLVVTHYGFTAFEALSAGCAVVLVATSPLHEQLAEKYGFVCLKKNVSAENVKKLLSEKSSLFPPSPLGEENGESKDAYSFVTSLSRGHRFSCPVCASFPETPDSVVARTEQRTFRRCSKCSMIYISWTKAPENTAYNKSYFYEDYKAQYGKTYLEDFASIKAQGVRRITNIEMIFRSGKNKSVTPSVLDIGCAMGPFIDAAADSGWQVYGTDISSQAVEYVQKTLHYPAVCSSFPDFNPSKSFGVQSFDAVTMWYVIEHFQNLGEVLQAVSRLVKKDGIFAFSTPSASGVSATFNRQSFFEQSPEDHYTLWENENAQKILSLYGFKVVKIVSTGHHPERFPYAKKHSLKAGTLRFEALRMFSRVKNLGDTFEVYCKKISDEPINK